MTHSATFSGHNGIAINGYIRDGVLYVGCVMNGRLEDGTVLNATGYKPHRILYQTKSTNSLTNYAPGSIGNYVVTEVES